MLSIRGLHAGYGAASALRGVSLEVPDGRTVALVGANGAGKSTVLRAISGLVRVSAGEMLYDGAPLSHLTPPQRVARGIVHVPEGRDVFGSLTIRENLQLGAYAARKRDGERAVARRFDDVLERFPPLQQRLDRPAAELSGGQQQMLAIGRGLMAGPRLLLLDEPSLGLAPALVEQIFAIVRGLREVNVTVLIAEQNARQTLGLADRGYVLENGSIVASGSGAELLDDASIVERYLGVGATGPARRDSQAVQALSERLARTLQA